MLIFQRKFWKSGLGSELFSITILLLGMAVLAGIIIWFSTYDAAIQSQIIADTVVDGAVSFAQNDMNIAEKPFEIAARRIFDANRTLTGENRENPHRSSDLANRSGRRASRILP